MNPGKLQRIVVDALDDIKAQDIRVFDTTAQTELFDRVIVATGTSNRQTRSLAAHVRDKVREAGARVLSIEGTDTGEWVLVDLGDIVVHVMQPAIRQYYNLEELWGTKPVRMRIGKAAPKKADAEPRAPDAAAGRAGTTAARRTGVTAAKHTGTTAAKRTGTTAAKRTGATATKRAGVSATKRAAAPAKGAAAAKRPATRRASNG